MDADSEPRLIGVAVAIGLYGAVAIFAVGILIYLAWQVASWL